MNRTRTISLALAFTALAPLAAEVPAAAESLSPRLTHADLAARGGARTNPLEGRREVTEIDHATVQKKKERRELGAGSLLSRSLILSFRGSWTIVPKGAILHLPKSYQDRVVTRPSGRLIPWSEFHARNRGWIHTQNVSIENARGDVALSPEILELHKRLGRVVVAVLHRGPISVKAPVQPEKSPAAPEAEAVAANSATR